VFTLDNWRIPGANRAMEAVVIAWSAVVIIGPV
jgi:hypothetical protein